VAKVEPAGPALQRDKQDYVCRKNSLVDVCSVCVCVHIFRF